MKRLVFRAVAFSLFLALGLLALELLTRWAFTSYLPPSYDRARRFLAGELAPDPIFQNCIGQSYLNYVPTPNYQSATDGVHHNAHGYPGTLVPLRRTPDVARVLCLGGSTTYGWGAPTDQSYPAHLERLLNRELPAGVKGVEVINGGLPSGTTAENLTHYQFKFRYYYPDLVIINVGGNDAYGWMIPYYHPDNSHWRQPMWPPLTLPSHSRFLARSRLLSLLVLIPLFYDWGQPGSPTFIRPWGLPPVVRWYDRYQGQGTPGDVFPEEVSFRVNLRAMIQLVQAAGSRVLLVNFREAPDVKKWKPSYTEWELWGINYERKTMEEFARTYDVALAPFPQEAITPANWIDLCHTNGAGNLEKARHVEGYARQILFNSEAPVVAASPSASPSPSPSPSR